VNKKIKLQQREYVFGTSTYKQYRINISNQIIREIGWSDDEIIFICMKNHKDGKVLELRKQQSRSKDSNQII